jgi:hypothetical protein
VFVQRAAVLLEDDGGKLRLRQRQAEQREEPRPAGPRRRISEIEEDAEWTYREQPQVSMAMGMSA